MNNDLNDLITRGAVCDMLHDEMGAWGNCADEIEALLKANDALWEIPAVDAVEVCRCKDCIYYEAEECVCPYIWMSDGAHLWTGVNDFCSYGERRSE